MPTIDQLKEQETPPTPLFLFECVFETGRIERWSTHAVTISGNVFAARLLQHDLFTLQSSADDGLDAPQKISLSLANADSHFSQVERQDRFKGAKLTVSLVFVDLESGTLQSEVRVIFRGSGYPAEEITEAGLRVSFVSRLSLQRVILPEVRIERRCPWTFPTTAAQRAEAVTGDAKGKFSPLYRCGYSPDQTQGVGSLNGAVPFSTCDLTRTSCQQRGMFDVDSLNHVTRRFGGVEFVPSQIQVRSYGEKGTHLSPILDNQGRYNDFVPLVYGTAWYKPPVVFARNDGNLTRLEVLLGMGEIESVIKVVANGIEIPLGQTGIDLTATGWYDVVTAGGRSGGFNLNFADAQGNPQGDPYGSMALLSVVLPNQVSNGATLPKISVLLRGLKLERFDSSGASLGQMFSNNPAWVLLDVLRRSGWLPSEVDLASFSTGATYCDEAITTKDLYGNTVAIPRFQCNLVVQGRRSAAEVIKGIRNCSTLSLRYGTNGLLTLRVEGAIASQQPAKPSGSNSSSVLNGGWPAYEFGDTPGTGGIARRLGGESSVRLWSRIGADTANRINVEFQDEFNEYQQDSLALVDIDDTRSTGREVTSGFAALGIANFDQAARILRLQLNKTLRGYTFVDLDTTVRAASLAPGDIITVTYAKEGLERQLFRVVKIVPEKNYQTARITAQWHDDSWYTVSGSDVTGGQPNGSFDSSIPRPLIGSILDVTGKDQFGVEESVIQGATGSAVALNVSFITPSKPGIAAAAVPLLSLSPVVSGTGGSIAGNQSLYYAVSAVDASGIESRLSFVVRATLSATTNTNTITLTGLSFSASTAAFHVYRGTNPSQLRRIASNVAVGISYLDSGATAQLIGPPDPNYDHANFSWRRELQPEFPATIYSPTSIGNSSLGMAPNDFKGAVVRISRGKGSGFERTVASNSATTLTVNPAWSVTPDTTSVFSIVDSGWNFGTVGVGSPVQLQVPNWGGQTIQISGRSANAADTESQLELNPITRWQIGSGGAEGIDRDVPPLPTFGLFAAGQGTVDLLGISFPSLTNTNTIKAGTLTIHSWDELSGPVPTLGVAISTTGTALLLSFASSAQVNDLLQVGKEIVVVTSVGSGGVSFTVTRASQGSIAASHSAGDPVYALQRTVIVVPFVPGFWGSPASGSYLHSLYLPDVRIGAAELYLTNAIGNGPVKHNSYGFTTDSGLRTLSGGQMSLQVEGYLAIQTSSTPPFIVENSHAARDIFATVREAPSGGPIVLAVRQNSTNYCTLTIPDGATTSNVVSGFGLPALAVNSQIYLDITSVPGAANTLPGRDLTVTIRL